jgi:D-alanyl-D-alanine carboxypeptidase/D-alanyl-D-alanine-endopeptidase (penicillin-binding protein 4)
MRAGCGAVVISIGCALLGAQAAAAATPIPPSVQAAIGQAQSKPAYESSTWGLRVVDQDTGEVLIDQLGEKLFVTGSTMKTYATAAALASYGADYRFRTPVYRTGAVRGESLRGDLVLVASGDFSFGLREQPGGTLGFNDSPEIDHNYADIALPGPTLVEGSHPLAGVNDLARQVRNSGIRRVSGEVVIDDRLFEEFTWVDGLASPIWVNENVIDMRVTPSSAGERAKLFWRPKTPALRVVNRVKTGVPGSQTSLTADGPTDGTITLRGRIAADSAPLLQVARIPHPADFARTAFIQALRRQGISVSASAAGVNPDEELPRERSLKPAKRVALRVSDPLSEYVKVILKVSYNRGTALMTCLLAVAAGSKECADGLASIVANNAALGVSPLTTYPFDGAGSDDRDRSSPIAATTFLSNVLSQPYGSALYDGLPILGVDGNLRETGLGSPAAGKIRAKTGNRIGFPTANNGIAGAQTRMGYIEAASGRRLVYADFIRDVPLTALTDIFDIDLDMTAVETAIQQGY